MTDPFETLRAELVRAASDAPAPAPVRARRWPWVRSHPAAVVLAALVLSGSAAAAAVTLGTTSSEPLSGRVPGVIEPASLAGYRYTITVTPSLAAGSAGWDSGITYTGTRGGGGGTSGTTSYASANNPIFGGSANAFGWSGQSQRGDTVEYVLTAPAVAAVRIGNRTIATFTSPRLPAGDRAAVFFLPARAPVLVSGWQPGQPIRSFMRAPSGPRGAMRQVATLAILPLDREGQPIPSRIRAPFGSAPSFWQAPSAVTPRIQEAPYHGPEHPRPGVCTVAEHGQRGLTAEWGHTLSSISPARDSVGELFLSCLDAEYYFHGWGLGTGVLLDARAPGRTLGAIPGAVPVPGHAQTVDVPGASFTARRQGEAWLAVHGGASLAQRLQVLDALRLSRLDLHRIARSRAPF